jgi:hypothetical protein
VSLSLSAIIKPIANTGATQQGDPAGYWTNRYMTAMNAPFTIVPDTTGYSCNGVLNAGAIVTGDTILTGGSVSITISTNEWPNIFGTGHTSRFTTTISYTHFNGGATSVPITWTPTTYQVPIGKAGERYQAMYINITNNLVNSLASTNSVVNLKLRVSFTVP